MIMHGIRVTGLLQLWQDLNALNATVNKWVNPAEVFWDSN